MTSQGKSPGLRVVVDARLVSGEYGGVEGVIIGLAHGLSQLDGPEEFVFAVREGHEEWLASYVSGSSRLAIHRAEAVVTRPKARGLGRRITKAISRLRPKTDPAQAEPPRRAPGRGSLPQRDPFVESLGPDIVHMPIQRGFLAMSPSIYHPHDLQHVHLPEFFNAGQLAWRERWYGALCRHASLVAVSSEWTRRDVVNHFDLPEDRVRVVPLAPFLAATRVPTEEEAAAIRRRLDLPERYLLYPAQTWPHKNHLRLLEALALLRDDRGLVVPLVASGRQNAYFETLSDASRTLGLEDQVRWTGFVPTHELQAILMGARGVVIPTLFEAASAPLWEAFQAGVPAACSNVTSLPEQADDAAIVFEPLDVSAIANAIAMLWQDEDLRRRLIESGRSRVAELSWPRTARIFRAHYRRISGSALTEEDRVLVG